MQTTPPWSSKIANKTYQICYHDENNWSVLTVVIQSVNDCFKAVVLHNHVQNAVVSADDVFPSLNQVGEGWAVTVSVFYILY